MLALAMLLGLNAAQAQEINIAIDPELAHQMGLDARAVEEEIRNATRGTLKLDEPQIFLDQMASANAFAASGMGVDYASNPQRFYAGGSFGTATSGAGFSFAHGGDTLPTAGFALQASANAGLNLGILSPDESFLRRFVLSVNGIWAQGASGPFDAELYNVGAHLQLKLVRPPGQGAVVQWGGLDLTSGYQLASYRLTLSETLPVATEGLRWDATGTFDVRAESHTIPVEVSTNLRVLVVTVYGGAAVDVRRKATADGLVEVSGPVIASYQQEERTIGTAEARYALQGTTAEYAPRVFGGAQVNILFVKVYGHLNVGFDDTYAGHLGARVAF